MTKDILRISRNLFIAMSKGLYFDFKYSTCVTESPVTTLSGLKS